MFCRLDEEDKLQRARERRKRAVDGLRGLDHTLPEVSAKLDSFLCDDMERQTLQRMNPHLNGGSLIRELRRPLRHDENDALQQQPDAGRRDFRLADADVRRRRRVKD